MQQFSSYKQFYSLWKVTEIEMEKGKTNIHLKEQHTQIGIIKLSESEPSHLF